MSEKAHISDTFSFREISVETLFKANYSKLIFFANRFVNNLEEAEELVSDVFANLWVNQHKYSFSLTFTGFLYKMVQNSCLNYLKHKKVENKYVNYLTENNLLHESLFVRENTIVTKELEFYINEAIENLPDRCKEVFKLSRYEEKKNKEIANI